MIWPIKKLGEILEGKNRNNNAARHYIIYLDGNSDDNFIGAVLTSAGSKKYKNNVQMSKDHFLELDQEGNKYKVIYKNSNLVKGRFIKLKYWGPFKKVGELSESGIEFVRDSTDKMEPMLWEDYIKKYKQR